MVFVMFKMGEEWIYEMKNFSFHKVIWNKKKATVPYKFAQKWMQTLCKMNVKLVRQWNQYHVFPFCTNEETFRIVGWITSEKLFDEV